MTRLALSLAAALFATSAMAQPALMTQNLTCVQAQGIVAARGAVLLHTSPRTWDHYVSGQHVCVTETSAQLTTVPTRDTPQCPLYTCRQIVEEW